MDGADGVSLKVRRKDLSGGRTYWARPKALQFPIDWREPFGLVMIDAMACETPTTAWRLRSVPEVIDDRATEFVVDAVHDAVSTVNRIDSLDRQTCLRVFDVRFRGARTARDYM